MFLRKKIRTAVPMALVLLSLVSSAAAQEDAATQEARVHHEKGIAELKAERPDYAEAYREFKTAYAVSPKWQILGSLGIAALHLERDGQAIAAFEKFLVEGGSNVPADIRSQTENDLATLKATLVRVSITVNQSGATLVDERLDGVTPVVNRYEPLASSAVIGVRAGRHRMTVTLPGYEPAVWEFDGAPKTELSHAFNMEPASASGAGSSAAGAPSMAAPAGTEVSPPDRAGRGRGRVSPAFIVGAVGTGALLVGAGISSGITLATTSKYEDANDGSNVSRADRLRDDVKQQRLITDVLWIAGLLAAGGTTYLYLNAPRADTRESRAARRELRVVPVVAPQQGWITLSGTF